LASLKIGDPTHKAPESRTSQGFSRGLFHFIARFSVLRPAVTVRGDMLNDLFHFIARFSVLRPAELDEFVTLLVSISFHCTL